MNLAERLSQMIETLQNHDSFEDFARSQFNELDKLADGAPSDSDSPMVVSNVAAILCTEVMGENSENDLRLCGLITHVVCQMYRAGYIVGVKKEKTRIQTQSN